MNPNIPIRPRPFFSPGFTIIELLVVVMIIGILTALAIPHYLKSAESAKADAAASVVQEIAAAQRAYFINNGAYTINVFDGSNIDPAAGCASSACLPGPSYDPAACQKPYNLFNCHYMDDKNWQKDGYAYYSCNPQDGSGTNCCATGITACAVRKSGNSPEGTSDLTYLSWGYAADGAGHVTSFGGAPGKF